MAEEDATPGNHAPGGTAVALDWPRAFLLLLVVLFFAYLHLPS